MRADMAQMSEDMMNPSKMMNNHSPINTSMSPAHDMMSMSMSDMGAMLEGKTGDDLDRSFLEGMIPHHQGAVDMAKYLSGAKHPELRQLGIEIMAAQNREIAQMKQWQKDWGYTTTATGTVESPGSAMMRDHCRSMPEMAGCEKFK